VVSAEAYDADANVRSSVSTYRLTRGSLAGAAAQRCGPVDRLG
jgi:hypothetical protein